MPARRIDSGRLPVLRAAAQLLHRPTGAGDPASIAGAIGGAQAQDIRQGRLAFRSRSRTLTAADVDRARTEDRSLLRAWVMRGTMHLIATEDAGWLRPLYEPRHAAWSSRRLRQLGIAEADQERALREIGRALEDGPLSRDDVVERLRTKGIDLDPATRMHVVMLATVRGVACLGPDVGGRAALVLERDWIGERPAFDREAALRELARRYVGAFGPVTEPDFAAWSGLPLRDLRPALEAIASELTEVRIGAETGWVARTGTRRAAGRLVRLLPGWDTHLMGYRNRDFLARPDRWSRIMLGGGLLRPVVLVDGVAVGTWRSRRARETLRVEITPFGPIDQATIRALEEEAVDVGRFEGLATVLEITDDGL